MYSLCWQFVIGVCMMINALFILYTISVSYECLIPVVIMMGASCVCVLVLVVIVTGCSSYLTLPRVGQ